MENFRRFTIKISILLDCNLSHNCLLFFYNLCELAFFQAEGVSLPYIWEALCVLSRRSGFVTLDQMQKKTYLPLTKSEIRYYVNGCG